MKHQPDRWRVEPGGAVGLLIELPKEHIDLALALLSPVVNRSTLAPPDNFPSFYITRGNGTYRGRPVPHKFVSVICDPPPWVSANPALGMLAIVGARRDRGANFFWQCQYNCVIGRINLKVASDLHSAHARISTNGGVLEVNATFSSKGEPWSTLPNHLFG
jgi:hypothetical protein